MSPRAGLDAVEKRKNSSPVGNGTPVFQPVAQSISVITLTELPPAQNIFSLNSCPTLHSLPKLVFLVLSPSRNVWQQCSGHATADTRFECRTC